MAWWVVWLLSWQQAANELADEESFDSSDPPQPEFRPTWALSHGGYYTASVPVLRELITFLTKVYFLSHVELEGRLQIKGHCHAGRHGLA